MNHSRLRVRTEKPSEKTDIGDGVTEQVVEVKDLAPQLVGVHQIRV
jgi:hypothetical protein